jgi:branched-chain amino acid transport system substrate-binding protein
MGVDPMGADPPIPVILTTETNPALLPPPAPGDDRGPPVFRLFPTDDNQAKVAADFIAAQGATSVWVVEDTSNPIYSEYLARTFMNSVYEGQTPVKVILSSNDLNLPPYAVDKMRIDWVFFAGGWRNALILIRQLQAMPGTRKPKVLLSDASANKLLLKYGGSDVEGVDLLHPLTADVFNNEEYVAVGKEAYSLTSELVGNVHEQFDELATEEAPLGYRARKWLGLRRVSDARRAIARFMAKAVNTRTAFTLSDSTIAMTRDENGAVIRKDAVFHVWAIDHNKFKQIQ